MEPSVAWWIFAWVVVIAGAAIAVLAFGLLLAEWFRDRRPGLPAARAQLDAITRSPAPGARLSALSRQHTRLGPHAPKDGDA